VIDVREPSQVVSRIAAALREFDTRGPAPTSVRRLLVGLNDALADSGPVELRITPHHWIAAQTTALGGLAASIGNPWDGVAIKRALRDLRKTFRESARVQRHEAKLSSLLAGVIAFGLCGLFAILIVVGSATDVSSKDSIWRDSSTGKFDAGQGIGTIVVCTLVFGLFAGLPYAKLVDPLLRARRNRALAARLDPGERLLHALKTRDGEVLIATDERILLAGPGNNGDAPHARWSLGYADISSFSGRRDGRTGRRVTFQSGMCVFEVSLKGRRVPKVEEKVLLAILQHRVSRGSSRQDRRTPDEALA